MSRLRAFNIIRHYFVSVSVGLTLKLAPREVNREREAFSLAERDRPIPEREARRLGLNVGIFTCAIPPSFQVSLHHPHLLSASSSTCIVHTPYARSRRAPRWCIRRRDDVPASGGRHPSKTKLPTFSKSCLVETLLTAPLILLPHIARAKRHVSRVQLGHPYAAEEFGGPLRHIISQQGIHSRLIWTTDFSCYYGEPR